MARNPILATFLKLFEFCRRYARKGLQLLLKFFSLLAKRTGPKKTTGLGKLKDENLAIKEKRDVQSSGTTTGIQNHAPSPSSSTPTDRTVVFACSTAPNTPPRARTRNQGHIRASSEPFASIDRQLASNSPTLVESPTSEGYDASGRFCASPERYGSVCSASPSLSSIEEHKEANFFEGRVLATPVSGDGTFGETCAEPVGMGAKSGEGQRKKIEPCAPSERPRYDRNVVMCVALFCNRDNHSLSSQRRRT